MTGWKLTKLGTLSAGAVLIAGFLFMNVARAGFGSDFLAGCSGGATFGDSYQGSQFYSLAFDGNVATFWASAGTAEPHFVGCNVGSTRNPAQAIIEDFADANGAYAKNWNLEGSNNATNWFSLATGTIANETVPTVKTYNFAASSTGYSYFRLYLTDTWSTSDPSTNAIVEFQLMEQVASTTTSTAAILSPGDMVLTYLFYILDALWFAAIVAAIVFGLKWVYNIKK